MVSVSNLRVQYTFDQIKLSSISNLEELDLKVLIFQNKKLADRLEHKRKIENELRSRIEQLEQKISSNDAVLCLTNRYWNQLDENMKIILERMDIDFHLEKEKYVYENEIENNLNILDHDFEKIKMKHRNIKAKVYKSEDSGEDISNTVASESENEKYESLSDEENDSKKYLKNINIPKLKYKEGQKKNKKKKRYKSPHSSSGSNSNLNLMMTDEAKNKKNFAYNYFIEELFSCDKQSLEEKYMTRVEFTKNILINVVKQMETFYILRDDVLSKIRNKEWYPNNTSDVKSLTDRLEIENKNLRSMMTRLHTKMHKQNLWQDKLKDMLKISENTNDELKNRIQDLEYDHEKGIAKENKFNWELIRLSESCQKLSQEAEMLKKQNKEISANVSASMDKPNTLVEEEISNSIMTSIPIESYKELEFELKQQSNLAENRLAELEKLHNEHLQSLRELEHLKLQPKQSNILNFNGEEPNDIEQVITSSDGYRSLQSQFSIVFNENAQLKAQSRELRKLLQSIKIVHVQQMEELAKVQGENVKKFQEDAKMLQDNWMKAKREHDLLRIEYEQYLSTKEQSGPLTQETKITIASLQEHNRQLKREIMRCKKRNFSVYSSTQPATLLSKELHHPQSHGSLHGNQHPTSISGTSTDPNIITVGTDPNVVNQRSPLQKINPSVRINSESGETFHNDDKASGLELGPPQSTIKVEVKSEIVGETTIKAPPSATYIKEEDWEKGSSSKLKRPHYLLSTAAIEGQGSGDNHLSETATNTPSKKKKTGSPARTTDVINATNAEDINKTVSSPTSLLSSIVALSSQTQSSLHIALPNNIKDLKEELKKSYAAQKELKLLLDVYKNASRDQRDKAEMLILERKLMTEIGELREKNLVIETELKIGNTPPVSVASSTPTKVLVSSNSTLAHKSNEAEIAKKLSQCEERLTALQKKLYDTKQEEEALLKELEVTGQAFEEMQEQNIRLLQQLREKDDANFKLMSERIKANQIQKLMKEEKETYVTQQIALKKQVEKLNEILMRFKEKEQILQTTLGNSDREANLRLQAAESYKKRAIEASQLCSDLRARSDKLNAQMTEYRDQLTEKCAILEKENFKINRLKEELGRVKDKLKFKKIDNSGSDPQGNQQNSSTTEKSNYLTSGSLDESVLLAEEVRALKELQTCPSCKSQRKDAVLSKCFHVFCYQCLKTRYDTRQRKCPKCAAPFGANDFHRLFLY